MNRELCKSRRLTCVRRMWRAVPRSLLIAVLASQAAVLWGSSGTWQSLGPEGGHFLGTVTDTSDASQVLTITRDPPGVYRSSDGGANWTEIGQVPTSYLNDFSAHSFSRLYAVTYYGCYHSTDSGETWSYARFPSGAGYARVVCADPVDSTRVYAAGYRYESDTYRLAFFESTDGGANWTASSFFSFDGFSPYDMTVSRADPNVIYVCGYRRSGDYSYGALLRSADRGTSWSDISRSVDSEASTRFYSVAVDPTDSDRVYVGGYGFYRSTDGGASWSSGDGWPYVEAIGIDPSDTAKVYAGGYSAFFVSTDYGQTWTPHYGDLKGRSSHVEVSRAEPSNVFVGTEFGLFKSEASGRTWFVAHHGIYNTTIPAVALNPSQPSTLFIEHDGCGVYASYDRGDGWQDLGYFVACGNVCDILFHPTDPDLVLALEGAG